MGRSNWLPLAQPEMLGMAQSWKVQIVKRGERDWRMNAEEVAKFEEVVTTAENESSVPKDERTSKGNIKRKNAFDELETLMRYTKKQFFGALTDEDLNALGLKPNDTTPTIHGAPEIQPATKVSYKSAGLFEISISPLDNISQESKKSYYGCKIVYDVFLATDAAPTDIKQLHESRFTRKKKEKFIFNSADSGKRVYFCVRYENSKGEAGPWGPISSAVIP